MSRPGRKRKIDVARFPSGQIKREDEAPSPTLAKRASMMALIGLADPSYGTVSGIFYLSRKIDSSEYEAAKRFSELHQQYLGCIQGPKQPSGNKMERGQPNAAVDPDSDAGEREATKQVNTQERYRDAQTVLRAAGIGVEDEVVRFCHGFGETPTGHQGMIRVMRGLNALTVLWKIRSK